MKAYHFGAALLAAIGVATPALADTVRCESNNGRERYCSANTRGGVWLQTQLSSSGCYQGDTWGYDNRGVWVTAGCRAIFQTGYNNNGYNPGGYYPNGYNPNGYPNNNNHHNNNDGAAVAVALAAVIGAAAIASSANKNKNSSSSYESTFNSGCSYGTKDRQAGKSRDYTRHGNAFGGSNEQAFANGYNKCWSN